MKKGKLGLLSVSMSMVAALFAGTYFADKNDPIECGAIPVEVPESKYNPVFYPADYSTSITNEPQYNTQKDLTFDYMGFNKAPSSYRGDSIKVAVIDSGLNYTHEDFGTINGVSGAIDNKSGAWLYYKYNMGYQSRLDDAIGHGTNVASVIASQINQLGCAGIAPNVDLYIFKVTNDSKGYEWTAINSALQYCIDNSVDVINMSFQAYEHAVSYGSSSVGASSGCSSVLTTKINACYNAGITLVGAAGNYNTNEPSYPASNNHVISVGSLAENSTTAKAGFSNTYGIDLVAPGYVYTADIGTNSSYKKTSGTSFSAPIVTAAIALYKQKNPAATPDQIESALYASCDSISGNPTWAGHGRLNVDKFLGLDENSPSSISITNVPEKEIELEVGETFQIEHSITPSTFTGGVEYTTYDTGSISVSDSGLITALAEGEDTVSVSCKGYSSVHDEINVIVKAKTVVEEQTETISDSKSVSFSGSAVSGWSITPQTTYCSLYYSGKNSAATITNKNITEFLNFASSTSSSLTVYVDGICNSGTNTVKVSTINSSGTVVKAASQITNKLGSGSNASNAKSVGPFTFTPDATVTGLKIEIGTKCCVTKVTYSYSYTKVTGGGTTTPTLSSINVSNAKTEYTVGDTFVKPTVTATYSDSSTKDVKSSATFSGFNSNTAGTQTITVSYGGKQTTYTITVSAPLVTNYTVAFNSNGGSGTMSNDTTNGNSYVVPACAFTKANYEFDKWALNSATGTKYDVGATISNISSNITLYATWKAKVINYSVSFNANGGSGTMSNATTNGSSYVTPSCDFSNNGYTFDGWALNSATGTKYNVGATISNISSNITLYAIWKANSSSGGGDEYKYYTGNYYTSITESQISDGGTTLITALRNLIQPKTAFGYSNIWTFNENYDKYPSNYDGTDPLTGNAYPTTNNTSKRGKMWDMYSDQTWTGSSQRAGSYNTIGDAYNREHSMPKSWFGGSDSNQPGTDPNHLFNTDGQVNNYRSNYAFGEVVSNITFNGYTFSGKKATGFGILGKNSSGDTVFEPDDAYKGDFARAQMYMATAYYDWNLTQDSNGAKCFSYSGGVSTMKSYYINLLTKWSAEDPVSQKEIDRNNAVYNSTQKNRNPFIDHPTWAYKIWGGTPYTWNGKTSGDETINVEGVSLNKNSLELSVGASATLTATVSPNNATNKNVTWESSDSSVATVANGNVTGVKAGTATITVKTEDGEKTATCNVTVKSSGSTGGGDSNTYKLVTSTSELVEGSKYVFASASSNAAYLTKAATIGNNLPQTDNTYTISSNLITIDENVLTFTLGKSDNNYTFKTDNYPGNTQYYLDPTNTTGSNYLKTSATLTNYGKFSISFSSGAAVITSTGKSSRNILRYNSSSKCFSCYSSGQSPVYLFKQESSGSVTPEIKGITLSETSKSIDLYSDSKTFTLTPTVSFVGDINTTVSWTTSDSSVASISANTSANGTPITVTANKVGSASISATCGEKSATCSVTITDSTDAKTIVDLKITPSKNEVPFMDGGGEVSVSATVIAVYKNGDEFNVTPTESNFKVDTTSLGNKEISATYSGITKTALIKVTNNGADVGETTASIQKTSITHSFASSNMSSSLPDGWTATTSGTTGYDSGGRGVQLQKSAGCTIKSPSLANITSIDLYVAKSSSGKGSFTISIGGTTIKTISTFNTTNTKVSVTLDEAMDGIVEITGSASASSLYIKQFTVNCEIQTGVSHNATASDQALAWSQYFLDLTSPICTANPDGDNAELLSDVWGELSSEYNYMTTDSKTEFLSSNDSTITDARERYMHIASHYGVDIENFTKAQFTNNKGINLFENLNVLDGEHPATFLTVILSLVGIASIGGYFIIKKRKEI